MWGLSSEGNHPVNSREMGTKGQPSTIFKRLYWRSLRALGLKKNAWDSQFRAGVWCQHERSPHTAEKVRKLCGGGRLIEFGCGEGNLLDVLPPGSYTEYIGYDISAVAVQKAALRVRQMGLLNCRFEQCDMACWHGVSETSLVLAEECLYYLSSREIETFLRTALACLSQGGHILVVVHSAEKHARTLQVCREADAVVDEIRVGSRTFLTLQRRTV